jgi:hypothetical protein
MQTPHPDAPAAAPSTGQIVVVVLYVHSLLGEGLARLLAGEPGLAVTSLRTVDALAASVPFDPVPDVVILERTEPDHALDVMRFAPDALVIEVSLDPGPTVTYHRTEISARPEGLLRAIRDVRPQASRGLAATAATETRITS